MAKHRTANLPPEQRIVITGVGLTSPLGDSLAALRANLLTGKNGVSDYEIRYFGKTLAGLCHFEQTKYQSRKDVRRGTRAGSIGVFCAHEAVADAGIDWAAVDKRTVGVYIGITEHGNVETENEIYQIKQFDYDCSVWSHHHNPRTVANNPAGEICLNMGVTGPHYTLGAACAAGNTGVIQGMHMLRLRECDMALVGGVSESVLTFGIFAAFNSQGALAKNDDPAKASRPFDLDRNGIVVAEGGCVYTLERLSDATARGAKIYGEIVGHAINTDATDFVLPNAERQAECMKLALDRAGLVPGDIDIVSTHATATTSGDIQECIALRQLWGAGGKTRINNSKSFFGHAMGAAGVLELAGNLPSFEDSICHATINVDHLDPECDVPGLVLNQPIELDSVDYILNNSFGMLGINSALIIGRVF